ncbi:hypothetical protein M271_24085 [Streptomyces rapamycinicus NRRL 5491]|nr:hypothetical protein M271_24085 [Streptomyces rapamycinicus NRRL 5491]
MSKTSSQLRHGRPERSASSTLGTAVLASMPACSPSRSASWTSAWRICSGRSAGIHHTAS